jgi:hypothetical protein
MNKLFAALAVLLVLLFAPAKADAQQYSTFWWNPSLNGMGIHTEHQGDTVALIWYHYTATRDATFLFAACPLVKINGKDGCTAVLNRSTGPAPQGYNASQVVTGINAGTMTIVFDNVNQITFSYNYQDVGGSMQVGSFTMVPYIFSTAPVVGIDYSNFLWNKAEDGMGYTVEHQGGVVAGVWYHYTVSGRATFLIWACQSMTKDALGRDVCTGKLYRSKGPAPQGYDASQAEVGIETGNPFLNSKGEVTVVFENGKAARLSYDYVDEGGQRQVGATQIESFLFGPKYSSKLVMSAGSTSLNGGAPISVFDLNTGAVQDFIFAVSGCQGVDLNPVTREVHILCTESPTRIYNPANGSFTVGPTLSINTSDYASVACTNNGMCVYGRGSRNNANFRGHVALVSANKTVKTANIALPDQGQNRVPVYARARGNKVYILTHHSDHGTDYWLFRSGRLPWFVFENNGMIDNT